MANYNKLAKQVNDLINAKEAPEGSLPLLTVDTKNYLNLDFDDVTWRDIAVDDDDNKNPAAWLTNASVKEGIQSVLMVDRCQEELLRIMHERRALQNWVREEWDRMDRALSLIGRRYGSENAGIPC